jgi:tetratricopeptide (TPR) repeat protein
VGKTEQAIQEFLNAQELEENYYRTENISAQLDWHHAHNLQLLALCYAALGQLKPAEAAFRKAFALPAYTDFADYNRKAWPEFLLDHGRASEALQAAQQLIASQWPMARFAGHALAGRAQLANGDVESAKNELTLAEHETENIQATVMKSLNDSVLLRGGIYLHEKNFDDGNRLMIAAMKDIVAVTGPDAWSEALFQLEYIAHVARESEDWTLAESAARAMISHDPSYAGGFSALAAVDDHAGNATAARQELATAQKLWNKADSPLPSLPSPHL